jgi:DNA-directed RNA polymerase subunit RPC12/RpoP
MTKNIRCPSCLQGYASIEKLDRSPLDPNVLRCEICKRRFLEKEAKDWGIRLGPPAAKPTQRPLKA